MPVSDLDTIEYKLKKRGFRQDDTYHHECPACHLNAVRVYVILGKAGGRDIRLCLECGVVKSFTAVAGMDDRAEDPDFDLVQFLA